MTKTFQFIARFRPFISDTACVSPYQHLWHSARLVFTSTSSCGLAIDQYHEMQNEHLLDVLSPVDTPAKDNY